MYTVPAQIDQKGHIHFDQEVILTSPKKVLVVFLDETTLPNEEFLLSESALAKDWLTPEEDEAWKDLPKVRL